MADINIIRVEVAYAQPHKQKIIALQVERGTTALEAVTRSGIVEFFPEIDLSTVKMGIFGESLGATATDSPATYVLSEGDRVEIYRPLTVDPKEARRKRAEKSASINAS